MKPRLRKLALTAHVTLSVGWLGAVAAYLAVAITGCVGTDPSVVRGAAVLLEVIGWFVIVPCSLAALLTGLTQALATEWGLFRHNWVVAKSVLTVAATAVLLGHMPTVSRISSTAAEMSLSRPEVFDHVPVPLVVHAAGGLVVLIAITALSIYKPWGKTLWAKRTGSR